MLRWQGVITDDTCCYISTNIEPALGDFLMMRFGTLIIVTETDVMKIFITFSAFSEYT